MAKPQSSSTSDASGRFIEKRKAWLEWLTGDDPHSIMNQIHRMIWDAAVFRVVNLARDYAEKDGKGVPKLNDSMYGLINECFFTSQASAVRRLLDKEKRTGKREVYSLVRLLLDMEKNAHLLTRANVLRAEGLPYDFEPVKEARYKYLQGRREAGEQAVWVPPNLDWHRPLQRHELIDRLAGVTEDHRLPDDKICATCLVKLRARLDVCKGLSKYVDKFVAHAASPGSRAEVDIGELSLTLGHLWDAHKVICQVASFVGIRLLGDSVGNPLVTPQFDQFEHMDRPLVTRDNIHRLEADWRAYEQETHKWKLWGLDDFERETGA